MDLFTLSVKKQDTSYQLEDHQDTSPRPSSLTQPITCITEGKFSSGGSPMDEEDLLRTGYKAVYAYLILCSEEKLTRME